MKLRKKIAATLAALTLVFTLTLTACSSDCEICGSSGEITEMGGIPLPFPIPCPECE